MKKFSLIFIVLLIISIYGCGGSDDSASGGGTTVAANNLIFDGVAYKPSNSSSSASKKAPSGFVPLVNAKVFYSTIANTTTDSTGHFILSIPPNFAGNVFISVEKSSENISTGFTVALAAGKKFSGTVKLKKSGDTYTADVTEDAVVVNTSDDNATSDDNNSDTNTTDNGNTTTSDEVSSLPFTLPMQHKRWTIMYYGMFDNRGKADLTAQALNSEVNQMRGIGSGNNVNIVVQVDPNKYQNITPSEPIIRNFTAYVKDNTLYVLRSKADENTGDPQNLVEYVSYCKDNFPADNYILILNAHGSGSYSDPSYSAPERVIGYDDTSTATLNFSDLKSALSQAKNILGKKIDILVLDSCLMANIETAYEVKGSVDYIVASEVEEGGFDYSFIQDIKNNLYLKNLDIAKNIVNETVDLGSLTYLTYPVPPPITMAVINPDAIDSVFISEFADFVNLIKDKSNFINSVPINYFAEIGKEDCSNVSNSQYYQQLDLFNFLGLCEFATDSSLGVDIVRLASSLNDYYKKIIPYYNETAYTNNYYYYSGLSVFFYGPKDCYYDGFLSEYESSNTDFNNDTRWSSIFQ